MSNTVCIIDHDLAAADELAAILEDHGLERSVGIAASVPAAMDILWKGTVDLLCIRIAHWDDYRKVAPLLPHLPERIVFLSGRTDKCTANLPNEVDAHLQPPYKASHVRKCLQRFADPVFRPRSQAFFFLRVDCHFHAIPLDSLQWVRTRGHQLIIQTDKERYEVFGTLDQLQQRLPVYFTRVGRGLLIAKYTDL
jgi:DNA-binding LytR/AlgR family response regulator